MTVVLLGVGALAVDLGFAYSVKRQLSATSDSAALAGAQEAGLKFSSAGGCGNGLDDLITEAVYENHVRNSPVGTTGNPNVVIECKDKDGSITDEDVTSITVRVDETSTLDSWFGRVLGVDTLTPAATATARVFGSTNLSGLRPFLVCTSDAKDARDFAKPPTPTYPLFQSYYKQAVKTKTVKDPTGSAVFNDLEWAVSGNEIKTSGATKFDLVVDDYVRLADVKMVKATTASDEPLDGFYYVTSVAASQKAITVSRTKGGTPLQISTAGTVDVYAKLTPDVKGATWNGDTITSTADHGLTKDAEVWVQVVTGTGATDGAYSVGVAVPPTTRTFTLNKGSAIPATSSTQINVYTLATIAAAAGGDACSPPGSPGNWGYSAFDLDSGNNYQLACLIKYGYGGLDPASGGKPPDGSECLDPDAFPGVDVGSEAEGVPAEGDQGNNLGRDDGQLIKEVIIADKPILLPVGSNWNGAGGTNAKYGGRGALSVKLCGYVLPGSEVDPDAAVLPGSDYYYFGTNCPGYADTQLQQAYLDSVEAKQTDKQTSLVIQWVYEDWIFGFQGQPSGTVDQCPLGSCVASLQLLE